MSTAMVPPRAADPRTVEGAPKRLPGLTIGGAPVLTVVLATVIGALLGAAFTASIILTYIADAQR